MPNVSPGRISDARRICLPEVEWWHGRWKVLSAIYCEQQIAGLDSCIESGTAVEHVQEKPMSASCFWECKQGCVDRMLRQNQPPAFVVESGMATAEVSQDLPYATLKLGGVCRQQVRELLIDSLGSRIVIHAVNVDVVGPHQLLDGPYHPGALLRTWRNASSIFHRFEKERHAHLSLRICIRPSSRVPRRAQIPSACRVLRA